MDKYKKLNLKETINLNKDNLNIIHGPIRYT